MRKLLAVLFVLLLTLMAVPAMADVYDFSFSASDSSITMSGIGTLTATDMGGGNYLATAVSGTVTDFNGPQSISLYTGPSPSDPSTGFNFDNLFNPTGIPNFTNNGLLFTLADGYGLNLYAVGSQDVAWLGTSPTIYAAPSGDPNGNPVNINFEATSAVPEPASLMLLGSGLLGMAGFARRKFLKV